MPQAFYGIELLPGQFRPRQLFVLLHGEGASASSLLPLAIRFRVDYPDAALLIPEGFLPLGGGNGRQWFPLEDLTEQNRPARVAEVMPRLYALVKGAQERFSVFPSETLIAGFSQGAIMALEFSAAHDGATGRVLAFSGRYARLPDEAPELTTVHLLHGQDDEVISVAHAYAAYDRLARLDGDATLDVASSVGHEMHFSLVERAIHRLRTCIPLRTWKRALGGPGAI